MSTVKKAVGKDLTKGSVLNGLIMFVIPIILTNLVQQLYSMVDLMVIGKYVGNVGTVGVSVGGEVSDFLTPVATAFATAGQIYIAQLAGANQVKQQKKAIGTFIVLMMGMSLAFMAVSVALNTPLLKLFNCPEEAFSQARDYLIITSIGLPFIFGYNCVCGILRGMGESKRPLIFICAAAVVNIVLDLLLVVVIPMEAAGTAIATAASQLASFAAAFAFMYKYRETFDFQLKLSYFKIDKQSCKVILSLGIPQAFRSILVRVSMVWVNSNVNAYGMIESGTNNIGNKLQKFLEIFSASMSQAAGAMIGQNLGASEHKRAKQVTIWALCLSSAVAAVISAVVWGWPHALFGIFTNNADVLDMGVTYLNIMIVHFFASAVTGSFQAMVIGAGNAKLNFLIGILDGVVCKVGFSLVFVQLMSMGVYGYFWGTAVSRILPGIICILYYFSERWKSSRLFEKTA